MPVRPSLSSRSTSAALLIAFGFLLLPRSASAQEPQKAPKSIVAQLSQVQASSPNVQSNQQAALDRLNWDTRMERARGRRATGRNLLIGSAVGGFISLKMMSSSENTTYVLGINTLIVSGIVAAVGGMKFSGGGRDVNDLQREGKVRGYLTVSPISRGAVASAAFSF